MKLPAETTAIGGDLQCASELQETTSGPSRPEPSCTSALVFRSTRILRRRHSGHAPDQRERRNDAARAERGAGRSFVLPALLRSLAARVRLSVNARVEAASACEAVDAGSAVEVVVLSTTGE